MGKIVAIVGRPNVGKSTLFNRLLQRREAIVDGTPGVTRDRHYGKSDWNGVEFSLIDTGGYITGSDDIFETEIRKQVTLATEEAAVILFVVDAQNGLTDLDKEVGRFLRKSEKPVLLVANKVDDPRQAENTVEFYELGYEHIYPIAAINGSGTGDLLDEVVRLLPETDQMQDFEDLPKITVVGKPNVGKSTFINALLDEERNIVTDIAGTTRDSLISRYQKYGFDFALVDTAGIDLEDMEKALGDELIKMENGNYRVKKHHTIQIHDAHLALDPKDELKFETIDLDILQKTLKLIQANANKDDYEIILYHISAPLLKKLGSHDLKNLKK
ncbi:unnamed protein product [Cyprideis torosa]|uniref:GTPase Der n=1 Tax=Cyprideis torosa TaxID=163714 RepID=A0A7R8WQ61_9CRUS|nr:unnamed protein product [Cyprideis torosa]CAG0906393.1 unnamed protein product [Cyprideis torosa]